MKGMLTMSKLYEKILDGIKDVPGGHPEGYKDALKKLLDTLMNNQKEAAPETSKPTEFDPELPEIRNNSSSDNSQENIPREPKEDDLIINSEEENSTSDSNQIETQDIDLNKKSNNKEPESTKNDKQNSNSDSTDDNSNSDPDDISTDNQDNTGSSSSNQSSNNKNSSQPKNNKPTRIGDRGNEEEERKEREEIRRQIEKENETKNSGEESTEDSNNVSSNNSPSLEDRKKAFDRIVRKGQITGHNPLTDETIEVENKDEEERQKELLKQKELKKAEIKRLLNPNGHKQYGKPLNTTLLNAFKSDLEDFKANCLGKKVSSTFSRYNKKSGSTGLIYPGKRKLLRPNAIPALNIYIDISTSWSVDKYGVAVELLSTLNELESQDLLKINTYYFADLIVTDPSSTQAGSGSNGGPEVLKHIQETQPENVFIITDEDLDYFPPKWNVSPISVPGSVWLLFRGGISQRLIDNIHGEKFTRYYDLGDTDGMIEIRRAALGRNPYTNN